jgi:hypothetical protein
MNRRDFLKKLGIAPLTLPAVKEAIKSLSDDSVKEIEPTVEMFTDNHPFTEDSYWHNWLAKAHSSPVSTLAIPTTRPLWDHWGKSHDYD